MVTNEWIIKHKPTPIINIWILFQHAFWLTHIILYENYEHVIKISLYVTNTLCGCHDVGYKCSCVVAVYNLPSEFQT